MTRYTGIDLSLQIILIIVANNPDIVVIDPSMIIDITISHDENLMKVDKKKLNTYSYLAHEAVHMWDVRSAIIVPTVVTAIGRPNIFRGSL